MTRAGWSRRISLKRFSRRGRSDVKKWIASYGFECVLQSMHDSLDRYYQPSKKRGENAKSVEEGFSRVLHLIKWQDREKRDPDRAPFLRIKHILRGRFEHVSWRELEQAIKTWRGRELPAEELADLAKRSTSWPNFREAVAAKCNEASHAEKTKAEEGTTGDEC